MSLTNRAYEIAQDFFESNEEQIMLLIAKAWPEEYKKAFTTMMCEDPEADPNGIPNLSMVCEVIPKALEEKFLKNLKQIIRAI